MQIIQVCSNREGGGGNNDNAVDLGLSDKKGGHAIAIIIPIVITTIMVVESN